MTRPVAFYEKMIGYADEGKAVDVIHVDFSSTSDTISYSICIWKLRKYWLKNRLLGTTHVKNWQNHQTHTAAISILMSTV